MIRHANGKNRTCRTPSGKIYPLSDMLAPQEFVKCIIALRLKSSINISKRTLLEKMIDLELITVNEEQYFSGMELTQKGIDLDGAIYTLDNAKRTDVHFPYNVYLKTILQTNLITEERLKKALYNVRENPSKYKLSNGYSSRKPSKKKGKYVFNKHLGSNTCRCENGQIMNLDDMLSISEYIYIAKDKQAGKIQSIRQMYFLLREQRYIICKINKSNYTHIELTSLGIKSFGVKYQNRRGFESELHFPIDFYNEINESNFNVKDIKNILVKTGQYADIRDYI